LVFICAYERRSASLVPGYFNVVAYCCLYSYGFDIQAVLKIIVHMVRFTSTLHPTFALPKINVKFLVKLKASTVYSTTATLLLRTVVIHGKFEYTFSFK